jgi:uncharacterized tellurite resistance protein B-like protein
MWESFKHFFEEHIAARAAEDPGGGRDRALKLAASALLFEVVRADGQVTAEEVTVMRTAIQSTFGLSREDSDELVRLGEAEARKATSLYEFTRLVDHGFSAEQKKRVVELLWLIAFADGKKDAEEEHVIRKIAGLLHVPHPDFIDAKIRARSESGFEP